MNYLPNISYFSAIPTEFNNKRSVSQGLALCNTSSVAKLRRNSTEITNIWYLNTTGCKIDRKCSPYLLITLLAVNLRRNSTKITNCKQIIEMMNNDSSLNH